MKTLFTRIALTLILALLLSFSAAAEGLIPVGQVVGLELQNGMVTVVSFDDALGQAAQKAGLRAGDVLHTIDGRKITSVEDVRKALECSDGVICVQVSRDGKTSTVQLQPQITKDGPKLGVYLKQGVTGIGTVTFYNVETGAFGTLGHAVSNANGKILEMTGGNAYLARVVSVRKGKSGEPGQLMGAVERLKPLGMLKKNTPQGVFGISDEGWDGQEMPVATAGEVRTGKAVIRCNVTGMDVQEYSVEILKLYPSARQTGRNMLLKVTDPELIEATGGIVQGMSGSPIIQDGKLVGAVTHVLVNDPTTGYGIFIENMLDAAV